MRYAYENACWPDRLLLPHTYYCTHLWPFYCHFICIFSISKIRNICHSFSINYHSRIQLVTRPLTVCERASMRVTLSVSVVFHWFSFSTFRYSGASMLACPLFRLLWFIQPLGISSVLWHISNRKVRPMRFPLNLHIFIGSFTFTPIY